VGTFTSRQYSPIMHVVMHMVKCIMWSSMWSSNICTFIADTVASVS
jgi:hypothetical protein